MENNHNTDGQEETFRQTDELTGILSKNLDNYPADVVMVSLLGLLESLYIGVSETKEAALQLLTANNEVLQEHINSFDEKEFGFFVRDHSKPIIAKERK